MAISPEELEEAALKQDKAKDESMKLDAEFRVSGEV